MILFADGVMWDTIEVHGHGTTFLEQVAANAGWVKTQVGLSMQLMSPDGRHYKPLAWGE